MTLPLFRRITIFGVGLIGGSFALALRKASAVGEVVGFGRSMHTLQQAQQLGIIDRIGQDVGALSEIPTRFFGYSRGSIFCRAGHDRRPCHGSY